MQWIYIICFALISAGLLALFGVRPGDFIDALFRSQRKAATLSDELNVLMGTPAKGFFNQGPRGGCTTAWDFGSSPATCPISRPPGEARVPNRGVLRGDMPSFPPAGRGVGARTHSSQKVQIGLSVRSAAPDAVGSTRTYPTARKGAE